MYRPTLKVVFFVLLAKLRELFVCVFMYACMFECVCAACHLVNDEARLITAQQPADIWGELITTEQVESSSLIKSRWWGDANWGSLNCKF